MVDEKRIEVKVKAEITDEIKVVAVKEEKMKATAESKEEAPIIKNEQIKIKAESKDKKKVITMVLDKNDEFQIGGNSDFKIGQRYPTPAPANGDRVFYESLLIQNKHSEMAQEWCVAYGVLPVKEATKIYEIICARKDNKGVKKSPVKSSSSASVSVAVKKKPIVAKRKLVGDDDMVPGADTGSSSIWEGQGSMGL
eukprot:CAMPEP_0119037936 /NCGR_PEP_ID=MMETSP1177-20130426/6505_1 /TAXON_ID=2985 /ORGANISM="Ochromonas sp, Strain CCMP1899" /LENGTH=195 /DNA_ID=CAMNT_0006999779 /DNA_START=91 /DNA_END=678 /DNA_ORIENTATION=-